MVHSKHMPGHSMPGHGDMCSMNMLFTWNWNNVCVIFKWWHIRGFGSFLVSFVAVVLLGMGYELLRSWFSKWEAASAAVMSGSTANANHSAIAQFRLKRSLIYGFQVGYSFMLMLIFMTYNGWLMIAVVLGAVIGNQLWGAHDNRSMSCH